MLMMEVYEYDELMSIMKTRVVAGSTYKVSSWEVTGREGSKSSSINRPGPRTRRG